MVARPPETRVRFTVAIIDLIYDYVTTILAHIYIRDDLYGEVNHLVIRSEGRRKTVRIKLDGVRNLSSRKKCWKYL